MAPDVPDGVEPASAAAPPIQFYLSVVDDAEALLEADAVQGIDRELGLLRVQLLRHLREQPGDMALLIRTSETIAKLVAIRYRMSKQQAADLGDAASNVLLKLGTAMGLSMDEI